jgi:hypothetical protein
MITLIPTGGLGNQMFQYAAAKSLSLRLQTNLKIDLSFYAQHRHKSWCWDYELNIFNLGVKVIHKSFKGISQCYIKPFFEKKEKGKKNLLFLGLFCDENATLYDVRFENLKNGITLLGYFQNEAYFKDYCEEIRKDFVFNPPINEQNCKIANEISACNAVSLHVRRGDYLSNKNAVNTFANLSIEYYHAAIQKILEKVKTPCFFIFSDDMEWAKQQFHEYNCRFVNINHGKDSFNDMRLMSFCQHNIIANSSFSWWGAYLNSHSEKIVIAPKNWFKNEEQNHITVQNLIPTEWTKM